MSYRVVKSYSQNNLNCVKGLLLSILDLFNTPDLFDSHLAKYSLMFYSLWKQLTFLFPSP